MPRCRERACLRFAIANHHGYNQVRIVERCAESVRHAVTQFAPFMNGARSLGCAMTADSAWERELAKEALHPFFVLRLVRIDLRVSTFQIAMREYRGSPVPRARDVQHIQVEFLDD